MRRRLVLFAALALLVAGCGGGEESGQDGGGASADVSGEAVFAEAGCGGCHTLSAAGSTGMTGPNLDEAQPDRDAVEEQVREGGGGMPSFEDQLSDEEIDAVADYVASSAGN